MTTLIKKVAMTATSDKLKPFEINKGYMKINFIKCKKNTESLKDNKSWVQRCKRQLERTTNYSCKTFD